MIFLQFIAFSLKKKHSKYLHLGHQVFPLHTLYCIFRASLINQICKTSYMLKHSLSDSTVAIQSREIMNLDIVLSTISFDT